MNYKYVLRIKKKGPENKDPFDKDSYNITRSRKVASAWQERTGAATWPILFEKLSNKEFKVVIWYDVMHNKWDKRCGSEDGKLINILGGIHKTINLEVQGYSYIKFDSLEDFMAQHFADLL